MGESSAGKISMKFASFYNACVDLTKGRELQGRVYLDEHALRFYRTYLACCRCLPKGGRLLSVGAGSAYVELVLSRAVQAQVTIIDFPEMIESQRGFYSSHGFNMIAADLANPVNARELGLFDVVLSAEIIEHLPLPPSSHIAVLRPLIKSNGALILTTPNCGNVRKLTKFILQIPILPPPEKTFGPTCFENEGVHRREYMPIEIADAMRRNKLEPQSSEFTMNSPAWKPLDWLFFLPERFPRWRATQVVTARPIT
jgi:hypothetical protein